MLTRATTTKEYAARLNSPEWRERSVLVFRGTGLNAWHYYPFLKNFSLAELNQFAAIYGMSGGAAMVWFYNLMQRGFFDEAARTNFDQVIRSTMNAAGFRLRMKRVIRRQLPYNEEDTFRFLSALSLTHARNLTFAESELPGFTVVAHDKRSDRLLLIHEDTHPQANVLSVLSQAGTPRAVDRATTRHPAASPAISDFDFASGSVKREFQRHLESRHPQHHIYQINMLRDAVENQMVFLKVCGDRMPRWWQLIDLVSLVLGLPNAHYRATLGRVYPLIAQ